MRYLVTGGKGFIGSHLVDRLISDGHEVLVVDNGRSGDNYNEGASYLSMDIAKYREIEHLFAGIDGVFHLAAIARTPWCIKDPELCHKTNVTGTFNVLEASRIHKVPKVILSSSNVVYAFKTPYRASKEILEVYAETYREMYGLKTVCLRYSNVYGPRQREDGPSPNVFAALRKSKRENGKLLITGDGEQSRDYTHVRDVVEANILAMNSSFTGTLDVCTGANTTLNEVAKYFNCPVEYIPEREGDIKHIFQSNEDITRELGWRPTAKLSDGINDVL